MGDLIFVAGEVSLDRDLNVVATGDVAGQTRQVIANLASVLKVAGATLADVVSTTAYLVSLDLYREFDTAYRECFGAHLPARATVRADLVMPELLVEIQAIAVRASS